MGSECSVNFQQFVAVEIICGCAYSEIADKIVIFILYVFLLYKVLVFGVSWLHVYDCLVLIKVVQAFRDNAGKGLCLKQGTW